MEFDLRQHLQNVANLMRKHKAMETKYASAYEFVLAHGREYKPVIKPDGLPWGIPRNCYQNTHNMVRLFSEYYYVEGYAYGIIPVMHAWIEDENGNAIDITWQNPPGKAYFGVRFPQNYVDYILYKRKCYGVIDNMEMEFPLITGEHEYFVTKNGFVEIKSRTATPDPQA